MKKMFSRIAAALTASAAVASLCHAFPASAAGTVRLMGDLDGDLQVTVADAQMALKSYVTAMSRNTANTADAENGNADIDMNGVVDLTDAQSILRYYCQTLAGNQPLWADFRAVSYHDGLDYTNLVGTDGDEYIRVQNETPFNLKGLYIEIGCAQGAPGETVTVPVYIAGASDLIGLVMFIDPPAGLEPTAITSTLDDDFELWHPNPEQKADPDEPYCPYVTYLPKGSLVFANIENIHPQNGYVLANYSYRIPADAQPGTVYSVCLNAEKTEFIADVPYETTEPEPLEGSDSSCVLQSYQYTLLNGVVAVK